MKREYDIDYSKPEEAARNTIQMHKDTLISLRERTTKRDELEWEIRVYDYMLEDPFRRLKEYNEARFDKNDMPIDKRVAIKALGWDIK